MSNGKIKVYKNPNRGKPETYQAYVPQYQLEGKEPIEIGGGSANILIKPNKLPLDNPRAARSPIRQPYAEAVSSPVGRGRGPVPNVGNNMEHTWSSVNDEMIDDMDLDPNHPMIDNNEYVTASALGLPEELPQLDEVVRPQQKIFNQKSFLSQEELNNVIKTQESQDDLLSVVQDLEEDSYLLIVNGTAVCSGPLDEIQEQARALIFGEHELCDGNAVPVEDLIVLKRASIKVGVFLE